jgi:hypothetical protein
MQNTVPYYQPPIWQKPKRCHSSCHYRALIGWLTCATGATDLVWITQSSFLCMRPNPQTRLSTKSLVSLHISPNIVLPIEFLRDPESLISFISPLSILRQDRVASLLNFWTKCTHYLHCSMIRSNMDFTRTIFLTLLFLLLFESASARYYSNPCCSSALSASAFDPAPTKPPICGQEYNQSIPAAPKLYITYNFCRQNCDGFGLSQGRQPSQWAAPIVQFILPSVIFSMTIPRRRMLSLPIELNRKGYGGGFLNSLFYFFLSLFASLIRFLIVIFDNIIWIAIIMALAGPMMLSGLYEAVLDWRILTLLSNHQLPAKEAVELLVTVVAGNLLREAPAPNQNPLNQNPLNQNPPNQTAPNNADPRYIDPKQEITDAIMRSVGDERRSRLLGLMTSQYNFGAIAGAPVLFYLGAFVYGILDLNNNPSDQDAAISLAFGIEWMIIVHVSIIAACILASNNPSTTSVLVGLLPLKDPHWVRRVSTYDALTGKPHTGPSAKLRLIHGEIGPLRLLEDIYKDRYQPVTMWRRGQNKREWIRDSITWKRLQASATNRSENNTGLSLRNLRATSWRYLLFVVFATFVLINLPPTAGAIVAWRSPPIGWGCRSLSFVCYAACQFVVVLLFLVKSSRPAWHTISIFYVLFTFLSLFFSLVGTLLQVIGVYRNCFCYVNADLWLKRESAFINVASDTQEERDSSSSWITFGGAATVFMSLCCYLGWWYQNDIRKRYKEIVEEVCSQPSGQPNATAMNGHVRSTRRTI